MDNDEAPSDTFKEQGNAAFQMGEYSEAVDCYTNGIAQNPSNAVLFSNRSAAYLKQNIYDKAKLDADMCIELDPKWSKVRLLSRFFPVIPSLSSLSACVLVFHPFPYCCTSACQTFYHYLLSTLILALIEARFPLFFVATEIIGVNRIGTLLDRMRIPHLSVFLPFLIKSAPSCAYLLRCLTFLSIV